MQGNQIRPSKKIIKWILLFWESTVTEPIQILQAIKKSEMLGNYKYNLTEVKSCRKATSTSSKDAESEVKGVLTAHIDFHYGED